MSSTYHSHDTPTFPTSKKNFSKVSQASMNFLGLHLSLCTLFSFHRIFIYINFPFANSFFLKSFLLFSLLHYGNTIKNQLPPYKTFMCFYIFPYFFWLFKFIIFTGLYYFFFSDFCFIISSFAILFSIIFISFLFS